MRTSLKLAFAMAIFILVMGFGSLSYGQQPPAASEKDLAQAAPEKKGLRTIPEDLTASMDTAFYSKYVWRGFELSRDSLVIFPSLTVGYKGFSLNLWVDYDTSFYKVNRAQTGKAKLQETDITGSYSNRWDRLKMDYTLGFIHYDTDGFLGVRPTSNTEAFTTFAFDVLLKPTLSVYREMEIGEAYYASLALSHSLKVYKNWTLDMGGWVSYQRNVSTDNFSALHDGNIWTGATIPLNSFFSIVPKVQYSFPLSGQAQDQIKGASYNGRDNQWVYGGISFVLKI